MDIITFKHFDGVETPVAPNRECVEILIGQSHKALPTVLEEREGKVSNQPSILVISLMPVASGRRVSHGSDEFF